MIINRKYSHRNLVSSKIKNRHLPLNDGVKIRFSKMHGIGNDFMVIDAITQNICLSKELVCRLADRHTGVGFDQLLIVEPTSDPDSNFHYRIFNSDGSESSQCGNGARCFASFVRLKGLTDERSIRVSTKNGFMVLSFIEDEMVCVNIGEPNFEPSLVPFRAKKAKKNYVIHVASHTLVCGVVSIGNPHCIIQVDDVKTTDVVKLGSLLENHKWFPERVNVGFMQIFKREYIRLRVYERGVGETLACGSCACAAVAVGITQGLLSEKVHVELPGGCLNILWRGTGHPLYMTGTATHIYDGSILLEKC